MTGNSPRTARKVFRFAWKLQYRIGVYFLLFLAGLLGFFLPPPSLEAVGNMPLRSTWAWCLILGGLSCMWGLWRLRFRPQILGSILCAAGIGVYAMALVPIIENSLIVILIFLAFVLKLLNRAYQLKVNDDAGVPGSGSWSTRPILAEANSGGDSVSSDGGGGVVGSAVVEGQAFPGWQQFDGADAADIILGLATPPVRSRGSESSGSTGSPIDRGTTEGFGTGTTF